MTYANKHFITVELYIFLITPTAGIDSRTIRVLDKLSLAQSTIDEKLALVETANEVVTGDDFSMDHRSCSRKMSGSLFHQTGGSRGSTICRTKPRDAVLQSKERQLSSVQSDPRSRFVIFFFFEPLKEGKNGGMW